VTGEEEERFVGYNLKRHHRPKPSDLAETLENFAHMGDVRLANGVMAQAAVGLTEEYRQRRLAAVRVGRE
jgi:hypothetical protein